MPDITGAYCSIEDIEGCALPERPYSDSEDPLLRSRPTKKQVETFAKDNRIFLDQKFRAAGIKVPLEGQEMLDSARILNKWGATDMAVNTPYQAGAPNDSAYGEWVTKHYKELLNSFLKEHKLKEESTTPERVAIPQDDLYSRFVENWDLTQRDTEERGPMFTRDKEW